MFPASNAIESWRNLQQFIAELPDDPYWSQWKAMATEIVDALQHAHLTDWFRAGQSMHHIVISTLDHHRMTEEPRVTLEFHVSARLVRIAYSRANIEIYGSLSEETVELARAFPSMLNYLRRLWFATKPTEQVPEALRANI